MSAHPDPHHAPAPARESIGTRLERAWLRDPRCVGCGEGVALRALFLARLVPMADTSDRLAHGACAEYGADARRGTT